MSETGFSLDLSPVVVAVTPYACLWSSDEGSEAAAAHDQEPRVGLSEPQEKEGVPAEPGGAAAGGAAGERASAQREPGAAAEARRERGHTHTHTPAE